MGREDYQKFEKFKGLMMFAQKVIELYSSERLRKILSVNGVNPLKSGRYCWENSLKTLSNVYERLS